MDNIPADKALQEAIVRAIVFFDLFDYPVSIYDLRRFLSLPVSLSALSSSLQNLLPKNIIEFKNGFYFLSGRSGILIESANRYHETDRKFKIARRLSRFFALIPSVRMIAVANVIGSNNLRAGSDIDLFIISSSRNLWFTRLFCAGMAAILRVRPLPNNKKDRICLSFYISEDRLNLKDLKLPQDVYFDHWLAALIPILNRRQVYEKFVLANYWVKECFPNWQPIVLSSRRELNFSSYFIFKIFLNKFSEWLAKKIQLAILPQSLRNNDSGGVLMDDEILKLYATDRRQEFTDRFNQGLSAALANLNKQNV